MTVRDLECWPRAWRGASTASDAADGENGTLIGVRWDARQPSLALVMEDNGTRSTRLLEGDRPVLTRLYLLLGWHIGRALARIGSLELTP